MHNARELLEHGEATRASLARRGFELDLAELSAADARRREVLKELEAKRARSKVVSEAFGRSKGTDTAAQEEGKVLKADIKTLEEAQRVAEAELEALVLRIPNLPDERAPEGLEESAKREIRRWGEPPRLDFKPKDHVDLGEGLGILDMGRAAKISGARFSVLLGQGAALERAVVSFLIDRHVAAGYLEVSAPHLVSRQTMTGTGQLPKFEPELFATSLSDGSEMFLIPTAEVPVTNLHAQEILRAEDLPIAYCAYTSCFRREAGSYGTQTRGLIRQHEFKKVELVRFDTPERSWDAVDKILAQAESVLQELGLHYRVVELAAGDLGFAASFCYDIEVWLPGMNEFREISSCSNFKQFQARRAGIRYRAAGGKPDFVATANGSGLPLGRTLVAILEQNQRSDGSVAVPKALQPYLRAEEFRPKTR
ncbi:MAG TPA: serine--tRNA ligase [Polyangiaceae bacterium]